MYMYPIWMLQLHLGKYLVCVLKIFLVAEYNLYGCVDKILDPQRRLIKGNLVRTYFL